MIEALPSPKSLITSNKTYNMTTATLRKEIKVVQFRLPKDGLEIHYQYNNMEMTLMAEPEGSAEILKRVDFIDDYYYSDDTLMIRTEDGLIEWDGYVVDTNLSQYWALQIVIAHEMEKTYSVHNNIDITDTDKLFESICGIVRQNISTNINH